MYLNVHKAAARCVSRTVGENCVLTSVVLFVSPLWYYSLPQTQTLHFQPTHIFSNTFETLSSTRLSLLQYLSSTFLYTLIHAYKHFSKIYGIVRLIKRILRLKLVTL